MISVGVGDCQLIASNVERCPFPPICRLNFNQSLAPVRLEAENVIAGPVPILNCSPSHLVGQVVTSLGFQARFFMVEYEFFACFPKCAISSVALCDIVFSCKLGHELSVCGR